MFKPNKLGKNKLLIKFRRKKYKGEEMKINYKKFKIKLDWWYLRIREIINLILNRLNVKSLNLMKKCMINTYTKI